MKKLLIALLLITSVSTFAQADKILGTWLNEPKDAKIEVYKKGDKYFGKIIWLSQNVGPNGESPKLDVNNEDEKLRSRPIVGINILKDLEWDDDDNEWDDGEIYDPRSGSTYSLYAKLEDANTLFLKGYIGFAMIGRSTTWTRVK
ncbi:DUF2147 domain-containing protein [Owenweeksia hongkongensis]|uniref:DUF2147 domain-containing protein n=1 Tax=Owenweeksia hongkongensis TaxID=253245 RepID=UPI003A93AFC0